MDTIGQVHSFLGTVRVARYRLLHHRPSLDRAISHLERSVAELSVTHPERPLNVAVLSGCLLWRYELTAEPHDLSSSIDLMREAIAAPGQAGRDLADLYGDLAAMLRTRFVRYGARRDLDEAIDAATIAITNGSDKDAAITNRALALVDRYEQTARLEDLLGALRDARTPVRGRVAGALHRGLRLAALLGALDSRYQHTGDPHDLAAAITAGRDALATLSRVDPARAHYATELSKVLRRSDAPGHLDEAVTVAENTLAASAPDHVDHAVRLSTLSMALLTRYLSTEDREDLRRARDLAAEALAVAVVEGARPFLLQRAGLVDRVWFLATGDPTALDQGERAIRAALAAVGDSHPLHDALACELADLLRCRPDDEDRQREARTLLLEVVRRPGITISMHDAFRAAVRLSELCADAGDTAGAVLAYRRAVELLPTAAWPGLRRGIREARLAEAPRATDAAAQAVQADDPALAIELLEAGRSVLWSQQLNLRTDLGRLRDAAPSLAERLNDIRIWFERPAAELVTHDR
jgi:tetratricopeptide (TPR) repeat protein